MSVNDAIKNALREQPGSTLSEKACSWLGSLGYTGTCIERVAKYEYGGKKGWPAIVERFTKGPPL